MEISSDASPGFSVKGTEEWLKKDGVHHVIIWIYPNVQELLGFSKMAT